MEKGKEKLYMELDCFKKSSGHSAAKSRTMGLFSRIGIIHRFKRFRLGIFLVVLIGYLSFIGKDKFQSEDAIGFVVVFGVLSIIALFFLFSGAKKWVNTISLIEYGTATTASVSTIKGWSVRSSSSAGKIGVARYIKYKRGCITCSFTDSSGKPVSFVVHSRNDEHQLKKGDGISVIYDPDSRKNVLAIDALPGFVRTDPPL